MERRLRRRWRRRPGVARARPRASDPGPGRAGNGRLGSALPDGRPDAQGASARQLAGRIVEARTAGLLQQVASGRRRTTLTRSGRLLPWQPAPVLGFGTNGRSARRPRSSMSRRACARCWTRSTDWPMVSFVSSDRAHNPARSMFASSDRATLEPGSERHAWAGAAPRVGGGRARPSPGRGATADRAARRFIARTPMPPSAGTLPAIARRRVTRPARSSRHPRPHRAARPPIGSRC